jgi:hypothetical protein
MPRYRRASHYLRALAGLYPAKDIVVWTPSEVDEWATVPQAFITTILREGRLLYDAAFWPDQATALEAIQIADHVRAVILALVPQALHPNNP